MDQSESQDLKGKTLLTNTILDGFKTNLSHMVLKLSRKYYKSLPKYSMLKNIAQVYWKPV